MPAAAAAAAVAASRAENATTSKPAAKRPRGGGGGNATVKAVREAVVQTAVVLWSLFVWLATLPVHVGRLLFAQRRRARAEPPPEPVNDEVMSMLEALKEELQGPSREKIDKLAKTLAESRTLSSNRISSLANTPVHAHHEVNGHLAANGTEPAGASPLPRNASQGALAAAGGFIRRTLSFGKVPPVPPVPPVQTAPTRTAIMLRNLYRWFARTFPDLHWALTAYRGESAHMPPGNERREIKQRVLRSPQVLSAVKVSAEVNGITVEQAARNAERIFETMAANMWMPPIRVVAYLLRKVFRLLYPFGMDVGTSDLQRVREAAKKGPIIYLPNHKSYLDFLVISYICFRHNLPLPHVVSGENLNIPLVGPILRYGGAFFIRRTFNSHADPLFRSVFNEYVTQLLIHSRAVECFIEGGRSRTGKVLPPKPGFLRCVLDAVVDRQVGDVCLIPISLGYDRIVENDSYIKELTGGKKNAERLVAFLRSSTTLLINTITSKRNYGKINVGIGAPISMHDYILQNLPSLPEGMLAPVPPDAASPAVPKPLALSAQSSSSSSTSARGTGAAEDGANSPETARDGAGSSTTATTDTDSEDDGLSLRPRLSLADKENGLAGLVNGKASPRTGAAALTVQRPSLGLAVATGASPRTPLQFLASPRGSAAAGGADVPALTVSGPSTAALDGSAAAAAAANAACPLPPAAAFTSAARKYLTVTVGYKVMYEINRVTTVLPATLVGTILFTQYGRGIRESDLVKKVRWLRRQVITQGGRVQMVPEDALHESIMKTVDQVLAGSVKGKLVKRHKDILMLSVYSPAERMELSLYRNQLIHLFVSEGILLCSFYACELESTSNPAWVDKEDLRTAVQFLSQLLKLEFIFKPSPGIDVILDQTVRSLIDQGILLAEEVDGRERYCVNDQLGADGEYQGTYTYLFICSLFWPFIDSYLLSALSLYRLLPDRMLDEESLIRWTQQLGETLYFEGMLDLYEAISKDTLQNGLVLLENWGVINFCSIESDGSVSTGKSGRRIVQLAAAYREESAVEKLVLKIIRFRKRLRAYRSRRYKARGTNMTMDIINLVKRSDMMPQLRSGQA